MGVGAGAPARSSQGNHPGGRLPHKPGAAGDNTQRPDSPEGAPQPAAPSQNDPENAPLTPKKERDKKAQDRWFEQKRKDQEKKSGK